MSELIDYEYSIKPKIRVPGNRPGHYYIKPAKNDEVADFFQVRRRRKDTHDGWQHIRQFESRPLAENWVRQKLNGY